MFNLPVFIEPDFSQKKFVNSPDANTAVVKYKGIAPDNYHATSMFPEYYKINGEWRLMPKTRMDCVPVLNTDGSLDVKEFRKLEAGEMVIIGRTDDGSEGIFLYTNGFNAKQKENDPFLFRGSRTRETSYDQDYAMLAELLEYERENGYIVWVLGPASIFNDSSRKAMEYVCDNGFAHAVLGGNAVATHDLECALFGTALGQDVITRENKKNGHYNHLDAINMINKAGSIEEGIKKLNIDNGLMYSCVKNNIPYVLAGSIRDDGPLSNVISNAKDAQDEMRKHTRKATTIICLATQLHTIATGNLAPSYTIADNKVRPVYIYAVDVSEFVLNKLKDRGTLEVTTIVSNIHDFLYKLTNII